MSLKPAIIRDVPADSPSLIRAIGPKLGKQFIANPNVAKYAFVLKFPDGVITGRSLGHALEKIQYKGPTLIVGTQFTFEARQIAAEAEGCDLLNLSDFDWTDATYAQRRIPQ
jgi:hypothetical protein